MMELLKTLARKLRLIASRGTLTAVQDGQGIQFVQGSLLADELRDMARLQDYGLTSHPLTGCELISLSLNGDRGQSVIIKADDSRHRPQGLAAGEVCLYSHEGDRIHLKQGRIIAISAGAKVQVAAPAIELTGDTVIKGNITLDGAVTITGAVTANSTITATGDVTGAGKTLATHTHISAKPGDPTTPPV